MLLDPQVAAKTRARYLSGAVKRNYVHRSAGIWVRRLAGWGLYGHFELHGGRHRHFKNTISYGLGIHAQLDINRGLLLHQQDAGGIGLLQRRLFEVNALDLEYGVLSSGVLLVSHGVFQ